MYAPQAHSPSPLRIVFCGSSLFGVPALTALVEKGYTLLVISQPDAPRGRKLRLLPSPLAEAALLLDLPLLRPPDVKAPDVLEQVRAFDPSIIVTASYGAMLKKPLRALPPLGAINLHPSLLPLLRGASPIRYALLEGRPITGVTLFRLTAKMDAGPILMQQQIPILPQDDHSSLHQLLSTLAASMLLHYLDHYTVIDATPQDDALATYCHKLEREHARLNWSVPAIEVFNRVRAFAEEPGAFCPFRDAELKILSASLTDEPISGTPGSISAIIKNHGFRVNCADRQLLINKVQPSGKAAMSSWAYHLGARLSEGETMGCDL